MFRLRQGILCLDNGDPVTKDLLHAWSQNPMTSRYIHQGLEILDEFITNYDSMMIKYCLAVLCGRNWFTPRFQPRAIRSKYITLPQDHHKTEGKDALTVAPSQEIKLSNSGLTLELKEGSWNAKIYRWYVATYGGSAYYLWGSLLVYPPQDYFFRSLSEKYIQSFETEMERSFKTLKEFQNYAPDYFYDLEKFYCLGLEDPCFEDPEILKTFTYKLSLEEYYASQKENEDEDE